MFGMNMLDQNHQMVNARCSVRAGRQSRRGSAIVLSVSALVLLSVLTLVYWGLGRSDVHTAGVLVTDSKVNSTVDHVADYIGEIIARDKVAWFAEYQIGGGQNPPLVYREATDFSWVEPSRRSIPVVDSPVQFNYRRFDPAGTMPLSWDPMRTGLDIRPFQASDPWLAPHKPMYFGMDGTQLKEEWRLGAQDWWSISNFAPDGRFVNLFNLRNNFAAGSGFSNRQTASTGGSGSTPRMMSDYLSLLLIDGVATDQTYFGNDAEPNTPADWTMHQQYAFRPAVEVRYSFNDPRNSFYQWADTDGDGFFDARWFEMVDASSEQRLISLLPQNGSFRWFFAARAVDLTGLVNVNTATDLRGGVAASSGSGDDKYRVGSSPADIDWLRLFSTQDSSKQNFEIPERDGGYASLLIPTPQMGFPIPSNYEEYTKEIAGEISTEVDAARNEYFELNAIPLVGPLPDARLSARERYNRYTRDATGVIPGEPMIKISDSSENGFRAKSVPLFGKLSLLELLTYRGTNDDANTSTLERVLGARDLEGYFSPLRDNRPLILERLHAEIADPDTGRPSIQSMAWSAMDLRQLITTHSGANNLRSSRLLFDDGIDPKTGTYKSFLDATSTIGGEWGFDVFNDPIANFEGRYNAAELLEKAAGGEPLDLFRAYAEALLPHAADVGDDWLVAKQKTLFYGHNPYRALLTAAHMTANAIDMYDNETASVPSMFTLLIDEEARTDVGSDPVSYPHWETLARQLDLGPDLLPKNGGVTSAAPVAINLYGIEAQPFLIEASMFIMYTDTPNGDGGDDDGGHTPLLPELPEQEEITIEGTIRAGNPDFITEILAFELTNPFDEDISLWDTNSKYYVEFAGHFYPLGKVVNKDLWDLGSLNSTIPENVVLTPNESRVFYASAFDLNEVDDRIKNSEPSHDIGPWIDQQVGDDAVYIGRLNTSEGSPARLDLLVGDPGIINEENRSLALWRMMGEVSDRDEDLMADRIRNPQTEAALDRRMEHKPTSWNSLVTGAPLQGTLIDGAEGWQEGDSATGTLGDRNTGMSIVLSGTILRPGSDDNEIPKPGVFPAWCIERKYDLSLNHHDYLGGDPLTLGESDFDAKSSKGSPTAMIGEDTLDDMLDEQRDRTIFWSLTEEPWWDEIEQIGLKFGGFPGGYSAVKAELHLDDDRFRAKAGNGTAGENIGRALRVADMLLPLGVGPTHMPKAPAGFSVGEDERWTTLGESMALAIDYDTMDVPTSGEQEMLAFLGRITDKGNLRLDTEGQLTNPNAFIPFKDENTDGDWDAGEPTFGAGVPIAYNVLDVFTTTDATFGSARRPRIGVVNINTAPLEVLRSMPLLTPPPTVDGSVEHWWWSGQPGEPTDQSDVAASIFAYINKSKAPSVSTTVNMVDFSNASKNIGDPENLARAAATLFDGIRETPGIRSLGELMAVRGGGAGKLQDMDYLGHDGQNTDMAGIESILYGSVASPEFEQMADDYDEKLAVINGMIGTASVRSDFFAVWFIVHGYQQDDVEGLRDEDPLTPTVAKRFVMVLDRSNVQQLGDKPRVLFIQEVPM